MTMRAGQLRHQVDVQEQVQTGIGDRGQPVYTWQTTLSGLPAYVQPLTGRELEIQRQLVAEATHKVTLRYQPVTAKSRLIFQGRTFNIGYVNETDYRQRWLVLTCWEAQ